MSKDTFSVVYKFGYERYIFLEDSLATTFVAQGLGRLRSSGHSKDNAVDWVLELNEELNND